MVLGVLIAVALQFALPDRHVVTPTYLFPIAELALLAALVIGDPGRIDRRSVVLRRLTLALVLILTLDNMLAVVELVDGVLTGAAKDTATVLLATGAAIWLTNVIAFSLWYWELDRGGPAARATGAATSPAFSFPEMQNPDDVDPRLGAAVRRLRVRVVHQRRGVQPDRHVAAEAVGQADDDGPVGDVARRRHHDHLPGDQHPDLRVSEERAPRESGKMPGGRAVRSDPETP